MSLFSLRLRRTHLDNVFHITSRYCKPMCSFSCRRPRSQEQSRNLINEDGCFRQGWTGGTQKSQTLFLKMTFDPEYIRSIALDQHMSSSAADTSSTTTLDTELSKDILDSWRYQSPSHMATLIRNPDPISFHPNPAPHRSKVAEHKSSNPTGEDDIKHRWIGTFFNGGILGGIDASYSSDVNGSNGSIRPSDTIKIMTELYAYAKGYQQQTPTLIDAGIAESRASCYWVALVHKMEGSKDPIEICGFERPIYEQNLKLIHKAATLHLEKHLQCSVSMNVVWKDCRNIQSLQSEFRILDTRSGVLYAFWTAWTVPSKMRLLALVAESKSIKAMALFFSRKDERSPEGDSLDQYFVLKVLNSSDSDGSKWHIFHGRQTCRFIQGSETANCFIFGRQESKMQAEITRDPCFFSSKEPSDSTALPSTERLRGYTTFGDECRDGWSEFCLECNNKFGDQLLCCETDNCPRAYCLHCAKETKARENFFFLLKYVSCITEHFTDSKE